MNFGVRAMRRIATGGLVSLAFLVVLSVRAPVSAEAFVDVYGGASFTQSEHMTVERFFAGEFATR